MKRKAKKIPPVNVEVPPAMNNSPEKENVEAQIDAFVQRDVADSGPKTERISLPLADGRVNWSSMRSDTRDRLNAAFKDDPEALAMLGLGAPTEGITEENARVALAMLAKADGFLMSFVCGALFKTPLDRDIANDAFQFDDKQLEEMAPRAARLANKYSTVAMLKYQDEIALAGMFASYLIQQTQAALMTQTMRNLSKKRKTPHFQDTPEGMKVPVNGGVNETTN